MFAIAAAIVIATASSPPASPPLMLRTQERPGVVFALTGEQITRYRTAALRGDAQRASQLADYYVFLLGDLVEGEFWAHLAAEYGGCREVSDYLPYLRELQHLKTIERLREWRERRDKACAVVPKPEATP